MSNSSRVKRDDVAKAAGVSSATVSRVFNKPKAVIPERRKAVLIAAEKLGYTPNKLASALRRNGSGIISLIDFKKEKRDYYWADMQIFRWFYTDVLFAVKEVVDESMFHLNLKTISTKEDLFSLKDRTDGIICYDVDLESEADMLYKAGIPYIICHHTRSFNGHQRCCTDNFEGGRLQAELLKENACNKAVYITGFIDSVVPNKERLEGFISVFGEKNTRVIETHIGRESGYNAVKKIIKDVQCGIIDGVAAVNDITAAGAGYALAEAGIKIQKDIPLVGYDNMPFCSFLPFSLRSIDIKPRIVYSEAAKTIIKKVLDPETKTEILRIIKPVASDWSKKNKEL